MSSSKTSLSTPLARVRGLGAAHAGTNHFWTQRLTALANVPLVIGLIVIVALAAGRPYPEARAIVGHPLSAILLLLLTGSVAVHMRLGMQIVIEDYVHAQGPKLAATIANTFFAAAVAGALAFSVLKIGFGS